MPCLQNHIQHQAQKVKLDCLRNWQYTNRYPLTEQESGVLNILQQYCQLLQETEGCEKKDADGPCDNFGNYLFENKKRRR